MTGNHNIDQFTECNLSVSEVKKGQCTLPNLRMLRKMEAITSKSQKLMSESIIFAELI